MKKLFTILAVLPVLLILVLTGCSPDDPAHSTALVAPTGNQIFANYVSMGNSLTAGYMDSGLAINGQMNSYPKQIANQIGFADFTQPYITFPGVGSTSLDDPTYVAGVLHWTGTTIAVIDSTAGAIVMDPASGFLMAIAQPTPYHNLGVPGALMHDVMNAYDATNSAKPGNSFFNFINRASFFGNATVPAVPEVSPQYESASMFAQTVAKGPSLVTCWIGNNDILGAATEGTDAGITDPAVFQAELTAMVGTLAGGLVQRTGFPATIILANIPSITDIPYFFEETTLEAVLGGAWPWGYAEENVDLFTFKVLSWVMNPANQGTAIPANYTLTTAEIAGIATAVSTYNAIIDGVAAGVTASGYANCDVMDANALMAGLSTPEKTHFMFLLPVTGGDVPAAAGMTLFSLDGVHPNNRGYGVIANAFIDKINELAGTTVQHVDTAGLVWDPTYGVGPVPAGTDTPRISERVTDGMTATFQLQ